MKGTGSAAVVLLHDGLLDSRVWEKQIEIFARYHTVIRYDRRGYGRSEAPSRTFSDSEDLRHLLRSLGVRGAHLVGMSNGGRVALDFTLEYPNVVDSLVLVGSSLGGYEFSEEVRNKVATTLSAVRTEEMPKAMCLWLEDSHWAPTARENALIRDRLMPILEESLLQLRSMSVGKFLIPLYPPAIMRLSEIRVPTLVIVGERDLPDNQEIANLLHEGIHDSSKEIIEGAGHMVNIEKPQRFNRIVLDFLSSQLPPQNQGGYLQVCLEGSCTLP